MSFIRRLIGSAESREAASAGADPSADPAEARRARIHRAAEVIGLDRALGGSSDDDGWPALLAAAEREMTAAEAGARWFDLYRLRSTIARLEHDEGDTAGAVARMRAAWAAWLRHYGRAGTRQVAILGLECCGPCGRDDGRVVAVAGQLDGPRLPHADCETAWCECGYEPWTAEAESAAPRIVRPPGR